MCTLRTEATGTSSTRLLAAGNLEVAAGNPEIHNQCTNCMSFNSIKKQNTRTLDTNMKKGGITPTHMLLITSINPGISINLHCDNIRCFFAWLRSNLPRGDNWRVMDNRGVMLELKVAYLTLWYFMKWRTNPGLCERIVMIVLNTSTICSALNRLILTTRAQNVPERPIPSLYIGSS